MKALILALFLIPAFAQADVSVPRAKQYLYTTYDVSVLGGATIPLGQNIINLGATMPAGSVISDVWVYINTQFAATGTESLALQCAGNQDLMAFTPLKNVAPDRYFVSRVLGNTFNDSAPLLPASPVNINASQGYGTVPVASNANGCNVSVEINGLSGYTPYTAGKLTAIIEYFRL